MKTHTIVVREGIKKGMERGGRGTFLEVENSVTSTDVGKRSRWQCSHRLYYYTKHLICGVAGRKNTD
jgi:hypothetical protein